MRMMLAQSRRNSRPAAARAAGLVRRSGGAVLGAGLMLALAGWAQWARAQDNIISHAYSTFGEFKYPADFKHLDYVNPDAPKGGEISIWAQGTFDTFNPYAAKGVPAAMSTVAYESILQGTADEVSAEYCLLCESIEYPPSEDWVIFHLRRDVTFSDGTPMTAQDVVFSHNILLEQGLPSYAEAVKALIPSAEALDDYTVRFNFAPDVPRKNLINQAGGVPVWSSKWFEETGARLDESRLDTSPGTGPYMIDSYEINRRVIIKRNPNYWGKDLPINVGRNNFDTIRIEYFADSTAAFEGFKAGEFTFRQENSSLSWATNYDFPAIDNGWVVKATLDDGSLPGATGFVFNLRREKFQDIRVRKALGLMYNFTWTNESLQYGLFQQRESFWQNSALAAKGVPEGRELELLQSVSDMIDPALLTEPAHMPHVSGDRQLDRNNLRAASALLDEAGWTVGADGLREKDGQKLQVEFLMYSPNFDRIINPYIENLRALGVDAVYNRVDPAQYQERSNTFDYDMVVDGYSTGLEEGIGLGQRFGTDGKEDVFNPAGYANPAVDKLIDAVIAAESYDEMAAGVRAIDRIMRADYYMVPIWYLGKHWVAYYDMFEHPAELPPYALGNLDFWWFNQEKHEALKTAGALR